MLRPANSCFRHLRAVVLSFAIVLAASGCAVRLLSTYDEQTDRAVSLLQTDVTAHLTMLAQLATGPDGEPTSPRTPACRYGNFADTYAQFAARAHVLKVRNEARAQNEVTTQQIERLANSLKTDLAEFHFQATGQCLTAGAIQAPQQILDQHFRSILKLELAKKTFRAGE